VQPSVADHKLFRASGDVQDKDGSSLITAYAVERPDGQWSLMLVNKDRDNSHSVKIAFGGSAAGDRYFAGSLDQVVFGAAQYQWHPDPASAASNRPAAEDEDVRRRPMPGHPDPDGPLLKSTVTSTGPDTLYELPKASIVVLRGKLSN